MTRLACWLFGHRPVAGRQCPTIVACGRCGRCLAMAIARKGFRFDIHRTSHFAALLIVATAVAIGGVLLVARLF